MPTRRQLLRSGATVAAMRAIPIAAPLGILLPSRPAHAVWWVAAAQVVGAVAGLMSAFSARGDGGIGALMAAVQQKLDLVIAQNAQTQLQLGALQGAVAGLDERFLEILTAEWTKERRSEINGLILRFKETQAAMNDYSDGYLNTVIQNRLDVILTDATKLRTNTMSHEYGLSYELMLTIGALMNVEIITHRLMPALGSNSLKERLNSYHNWITLALDESINFNVANQFETYTEARDHARDRLFELLAVAGRDGVPADGTGAARCVSLREYRVDVTTKEVCRPCPYSASISPIPEDALPTAPSLKALAELSNKRLASQLGQLLPQREFHGRCCETITTRTPVWGSAFDGERALLVEQYNHPKLNVPLLAITRYNRLEQTESCDFVSLQGTPVTSNQSGCAKDQAWREVQIDGAELYDPSGPSPGWEGLVVDPLIDYVSRTRRVSGLPDLSQFIGCPTAEIGFGLDQDARKQKFEEQRSIIDIAELYTQIIPLVDETNGQQLLRLAAGVVAAGLTELKEQIADEIREA